MSFAELRHVVLALGLSVSAQVAVAANTLSLTPADQLVDLSDGTTSLELWMDFDDPTLGGGIDLAFFGPIGFGGFAPSEFFINDVDESISDHSGPEGSADNDYEIHFGDFFGLSGLNLIGTIDVLLIDEGIGTIDMSINSTWGEFFSATDFQHRT